jgi:hypothetical protein
VTARGAGPGGSDAGRVDDPDRFLARQEGGAFAIRVGGRPSIRADPAGDGWSVSGVEGRRGWTLRRNDACGGGFLLRGPGAGGEAGRTMPLVGAGEMAGPRFLLLEDGRLFRIARRGPRDDGFDLLGWETPGEYFRARPEPEGWRIEASVAGRAMTETDVLLTLFAVEILDAEEPLRPCAP